MCSDDCDLFIVPSRKYVKDTVDKKIEEHAASRNHPYATLTDRGLVTLSNDTDSNSEMTAATSKAVKAVSTAANTANQKADKANTNANTRLAKDQNGADIPDKSAFVKNIGLGNAQFVIERGSNVYGAWVIWSDGAIELFGKGEPVVAVYPFVWLDAIHYKIREEGRYVSKAVYTVLALNLEGKKDVLGLYLSDSEGANFWLSVLTDLQNRGLKDILIACIDGLTGFPEAINSIYPHTEVQLCIIHQIRNSLKYVASKHHKAFMADLKPVYRAVSKEAAESALDELDMKWGQHYPVVIQSWRRKWSNLSAYFRYPAAIRKVIYTTNAIESVHRQFRKLTKTKGAFPNENSLLKLLYLGLLNAQEKWTMPIQSWNLTLSQLCIYFEGRLGNVITL
ncbi:IS256 family transposase [Xenorhabdus sp. 12]|uniref:Mutator family transposase n=1 Tax=Xenorhabdus santafensis TaxID=2582833 RepID=A0ABU4S9U4_9GAMM|nr:IS256 family transposase [Xenorhabdus sp. 12]